MSKLLSIIIPTYNMEKYLRYCLNSLIVPNEQMKKLEVLVINDGSKDSSSAIGHEYEKQYPQTFRVIDKENGNYGSCVNRGLKEAQGKYIKVLDADDSFNKEAFIVYLNFLNKVDVDLVISDYSTIDEDGNETQRTDFCTEIGLKETLSSDYKAFLKSHPKVLFNMHAITYKRNIFSRMDYHQTEGVSYTDLEWALIPMAEVNSFAYFQRSLYRYLVGREGQTMDSKVRIKAIPQLMKVVLRLSRFYQDGDYDRSVYRNFYAYALGIRFHSIYFKSLFGSKHLRNNLADFDSQIKEISSELYSLPQNFSYAGLHYVKSWRHNHHLWGYWYVNTLHRIILLMKKLKLK